jgi:hypothetical protein
MEVLGFGTFKSRPWAEIRKVALAQGDMFEPIKPTRRREPCGASDNEECSA